MLPNFVMQALLGGFTLGLAAVFSIGPQNLQIIQRGVARDFPLTSASVGFFCDIVLVLAAVYGIGCDFLDETAMRPLRLLAALFLAFCGLRTLKRAVSVGRYDCENLSTRHQAILAMLLVTLPNPLIYVEVVMLPGIFASAYGKSGGWFAVGFLVASFVRFFGLSLLGRGLAHWLHSMHGQRLLAHVSGWLLISASAYQAVATIF
jgi:L-lysine exporter family protein LysE/ArgO